MHPTQVKLVNAPRLKEQWYTCHKYIDSTICVYCLGRT